jgi:alanyl-tRNA synthetase
MLDGETAFKLYDTYGFPLDLTQDALRQRGIGVDLAGFTDAMERQKAEARASWAGSGEAATETVWFAVRERLRRDRIPRLRHRARRGRGAGAGRDGKEVDARRGRGSRVVVNQTPFYGESGGQMGDTGTFAGEGFSVASPTRRRRATACSSISAR